MLLKKLTFKVSKKKLNLLIYQNYLSIEFQLKDDETFQQTREVIILSKLKSELVVRYFDSWNFETNLLYIQMELCPDNLNNIIEVKPKLFGKTALETMNPIEYFISCHLFKEIVECLQVLHEHKPKPIIHRDLKPSNILVNYTSKSNRFLKLGDFGLATFDSVRTILSHTPNQGTDCFIAPEVTTQMQLNRRLYYNTKADIFSLGRTGMLLFCYDCHDISKH